MGIILTNISTLARTRPMAPVPPPSTVDVLSRGCYVPPPLPPPPQWLDPSAQVSNGSLFGVDGFWPRIIVGFMVGGALAVLIPILFAR